MPQYRAQSGTCASTAVAICSPQNRMSPPVAAASAGSIRLAEECPDRSVDQARINERAVRRDPDHDPRLHRLRSRIVTVQYVEVASADDVDAACLAVFHDRIIRWLVCRCHNHGLHAPGPARPFHDTAQHRRTRQIHQDLSWQA